MTFFLFRNARARHAHVGATSNHPCPAQALTRQRRASTLQSVEIKASPGQTTRQAAVPGDAGTWEPSVASRFVLRGPDYLRDKKKYPSAGALYEPFALDVLRCAAPIFDLPARVKLPSVLPHEEGLPSWCPRILCQNMFFPGEPPPLFVNKEPNRGPGAPKGWQVVCWWRIGEEAARLVKDASTKEKWPPHLSLWQYYAQNAETMITLNGALKGVARVDNIGDASLGLPRLLHQFNAKPVLMAASALVGERPGVVQVSRNDDYYEFGLDVGLDFAATSNQALFKLLPKFPKLICDIGWLVEGRTVAELPEGILACMRLNNLDLNGAPDMDAWLQGKL